MTGYIGLVLAVGWVVAGRAWRAAAAAVAVAGAAVCVVALVSRLAPDLFTNPVRAAGVAQRLSFPLNYWNAVGCWAAMTVALTLAWSAHAVRRPMRGLSLAGTSAACAVAYLTFSRSAIAGVLIAVVAVVALSQHRWLAAAHALVVGGATTGIVLTIRATPAIERGTGGAGGGKVGAVILSAAAVCLVAPLLTERLGLERVRLPARRTRQILLTGIVGVVAAGVLVGPALANRALKSFEAPTPAITGDPAQRLTTLGGTRGTLWRVALDAFERHPLTGTGPGTYEFFRNRDPHGSFFVRNAHSLYLENLAELGILGALLVITALAALLAGAVRTTLRAQDPATRGAAAGAAAALIVFCVTAGVDWMWQSTAVTLMALAAGTLAANAGGRGPAPRRTLARRLPVTLLSAGALVVQLPVLGAAIQVHASQSDVRARAFGAATSAATTATQLAPWAASGYEQRALVLEQIGLGAQAAADEERAVAREPTNWQHWLILGRIEAERGRVRAAVADARRAEALDPHDLLFRSQRTR
ncbi:MAG TPA: O-antigen ligase family protein [Solirubrobacteraceae bacterium]